MKVVSAYALVLLLPAAALAQSTPLIPPPIVQGGQVLVLFPPDSPNLRMLMLTANDEQKQRYLGPYARGELTSAIAISDPGGGGDPASMRTRAIADGGDAEISRAER